MSARSSFSGWRDAPPLRERAVAAPLSDPGTRQRLAPILVADVAGYSRLMAADERATVAALDAARAEFTAQVEAHQGRVIDMAGDSVLAVFETVVAKMRVFRVSDFLGAALMLGFLAALLLFVSRVT